MNMFFMALEQENALDKYLE